MVKLVLLRHGQSTYNKQHEFTGWTDVPLTNAGIKRAKTAGHLMKAHGLRFDVAHTSVLQRAIHTLWHALDEMDMYWIPVKRSWRLNERHYGALQDINKEEMVRELGAEKIKIWRRSFDVRPPKLAKDDERHPQHDVRYDDLKKSELPATESLKDCIARTMVYWKKEILPDLKAKKRIIIAAHGNSIRGIVKHLDGLSDEEITQVNIPTAVPLVYELNSKLKPVKKYYLGNQKEIAALIEKAKKV